MDITTFFNKGKYSRIATISHRLKAAKRREWKYNNKGLTLDHIKDAYQYVMSGVGSPKSSVITISTDEYQFIEEALAKKIWE